MYSGSRRRFLLGSLALGATAGLSLGSPSRAAGALRVAWVGWGDRQVVPVVDAVKAQVSDVDVTVETIPVSQYFQALEVRLAPRNGIPDVFMVDGPLTASYAVRGHIRDLSDVIDSNKFSPAAVKQATFQDKLYTAPFATSSQLLFCNLDLLEKRGVEAPPADVGQRWTWQQLTEAAQRVSDPANGVWGFSFEQADRPYQLFPLMQSLGARTVSPDGLQVTGYIDSAEAIEAFSFYQRLFQDWKLSPPGLYDGPLVQELFGAGNLAFMVAGTYVMDNLRQKFPSVRWGVAPHPYFQGGKPVTPTGSWHIGVNARSQNMDGALAFLGAMMSPPVMKTWFEVRPFPPVLKSLWDPNAAPFTEEGWKIVRYELDNTAEIRPQTPGYAEYEDTLKLAVRDIQGGAAVDQILRTAAGKIDRSLAKYRG